jgi:hypothetical protein
MRLIRGTNGYTLWLSANDTNAWASKPGAAWPCSDLSGRRVVVTVDSNGLCGLVIDGKHDYDYDCDSDSAELCAIVSDHLPKALRALWPVWEWVR